LAAVQQKGIPVRAFDNFTILNQLGYSQEQMVDLPHLDWKSYGRGMYVRYGDPDVSEAVVEATGDGRHVGTALQAVHRAQALLFYLAQTWPGGDRKIPSMPDTKPPQKNDVFVSSNGRMNPFTIVVPPGYSLPENANLRYPVIYFMHGYGMEPSGLSAISGVVANAMVDTSRPESERMQKFILVFPDGKCRPGGEIDSGGPLPTDGDLCEEGTFYSEHPEGTAKGETILQEFENYIDQNYRTTMPADL
jgi:hypothetical protein